MSSKEFKVNINLDVQAVTCPGVWLCPNGKIVLKIYIFDISSRTFRVDPVFPLLYHQKFIFEKTFKNIHNLGDLQHLLTKENMYAELLQCSGCRGTVLASFETSLFELLYPSPCIKGLIAGVDVNLLMVPTKCFPGILAPKIEVSTKTTIDEIVESSSEKRNPGLINPKMLSSKGSPLTKRLHQRKVSHVREDAASTRRRDIYSSEKYCPKNSTRKSAIQRSSVCPSDTGSLVQASSIRTSENCSSPEEHSLWSSPPGMLCEASQFSSISRNGGKTKQNKYRKLKCPCCVEETEHNHKICSCPVCKTYNMYFGNVAIPGCDDVKSTVKKTEIESTCMCCKFQSNII